MTNTWKNTKKVTKGAMMAELAYYCFEDVDEDAIDESGFNNVENFDKIYKFLKTTANNTIDYIKLENENLDLIKKRLNFLGCIIHAYKESNFLSKSFEVNLTNTIAIGNYKRSFDCMEMPLGHGTRQFCNERLSKLGVIISSIENVVGFEPIVLVTLRALSPEESDEFMGMITPSLKRKRSAL